jgi:hypothetical protein
MGHTRFKDTFSGDLFEVPQPDAPLAGGQNYRSEVAHLVTEVIAESGLDRYAIAATMSRLTGKEVSKYMLDAWSAESREAYNIPMYMVPVLETACETHRITVWLADKRGARALVGKEALDAQIGKLERAKEEATRKIKELKRMMGETE